MIASFRVESNADNAFIQINEKLGENRKIVALEKKGITFYKKRSGEFYIITLEPFDNVTDLYKALHVVKKHYKGAYYNNIRQKSKKPSTLQTIETNLTLSLPKKEHTLYKELNLKIKQSLQESKSPQADKTENETVERKKVELLSQKSMQEYLQEMHKYKKELQTPPQEPFAQKKEQQESKNIEITLNEVLIGVALFMLLFYGVKLTLMRSREV